jgi:hypothetical protein
MKTTKPVLIIAIISAFFFSLQVNGQSLKNNTEMIFADRWEFIGTAVEEPGYTIWGTSPIYGDDGKVHLFVARWPCELKVDPGWRTHSEIAHYVGDSPEGPFVFSDVAVKGPIEGKQKGKAPCNPCHSQS